jgi:hypothetical protein
LSCSFRQPTFRGATETRNELALRMAPLIKWHHFLCLSSMMLAAGAVSGGDSGRSVEKNGISRELHQHDILPILQRHCTVCHGARTQEAKLDLRTVASILKGGESGQALIAGNAAGSLLIEKISAGEMPPKRKLVTVSVKPVGSSDLEKLKTWIDLGAPVQEIVPDVAADHPDPLVSDADREFWAFKSPQRPSVPTAFIAPIGTRPVNPIDSFIERRLSIAGLHLSQSAGKGTLIRRVAYNMTGLPPSPEDVRRFLEDLAPDAYDRMVDRYLASPRYGERWGRHWLDLAGYSDSNGIQHADTIRPFAYRYRDYVIRALNADKAYDRFLHEQIAGDELADYESNPITEEIFDNLVATGFLRMVEDATHAGITNFVHHRQDVINAEMRVLSSAVLGLSIDCARCHDHKFDPIPQRDFYRLVDIFKGAFDENDWLSNEQRLLKNVTGDERNAWEKDNQRIEKAIEKIKADASIPKEEQGKKIKELEGKKKREPAIHALWDRGEPSPSYILNRGDYRSPKTLVGPGVPSILTNGREALPVVKPWRGAKQTGRRLAFAEWLTSPENPVTARLMVNRIWKHHFAHGIVKTLDDFGTKGARPTHLELLDWLAVEFAENGWCIKHIHRLILTSKTYQQSSSVLPEHRERDPGNVLLSRMPMKRLEGETLRDSLIYVSGTLNEARYGEPDPVEERGDGLVTSRAKDGARRRSIYVQQRRTQIPTILENFDLPAMSPNCIERTTATVAPQALHLLNNKMIRELAAAFAERVRTEVGAERDQQISRVHALAFGRLPTDSELVSASESLADLINSWSEAGESSDAAQTKALESYCHAILNAAEFLYID